MDPSVRNLATDMRYSPQNDSSAVKLSDTRKTRLTLKQINELRKSSEAHILDQENELEFVHAMYGAPPAPATPS